MRLNYFFSLLATHGLHAVKWIFIDFEFSASCNVQNWGVVSKSKASLIFDVFVQQKKHITKEQRASKTLMLDQPTKTAPIGNILKCSSQLFCLNLLLLIYGNILRPL